MTAALPDLADPVCESRLHEFGPFAPAPPATLWANWHGCSDVFLCGGCFGALAEQMERRGHIECWKCHQDFTTLATFIQEEKL